MSESEALTPENRLAICKRIGEEIGLDGEVLDKCLDSTATAEQLFEFRDIALAHQRSEAIRQGFYTPRTSFDGERPERNEVKTTAQVFAEWLTDSGF